MQGLLLAELGIYDRTVQRLGDFLESLPKPPVSINEPVSMDQEDEEPREETPMEKKNLKGGENLEIIEKTGV
jgi:hypothetical protein